MPNPVHLEKYYSPGNHLLVFITEGRRNADFNSHIFVRLTDYRITVKAFLGFLHRRYQRSDFNLGDRDNLELYVQNWDAPTYFTIDQYFSFLPPSSPSFLVRRNQKATHSNTFMENVSLNSPNAFLMVGGLPRTADYPVMFQRERVRWKPGFSPAEEEEEEGGGEGGGGDGGDGNELGEGGDPMDVSEPLAIPYKEILPGKLNNKTNQGVLDGLEQRLGGSGSLTLLLRGIMSCDGYNQKEHSVFPRNLLSGSPKLVDQEKIREETLKWLKTMSPIKDRDGDISGTSFAISPTLSVTCCHVLGDRKDDVMMIFREGLTCRRHALTKESLVYPLCQEDSTFQKGLDIAIFKHGPEARDFAQIDLKVNWWLLASRNSVEKQGVIVLGCSNLESEGHNRAYQGKIVSLHNFQMFYDCKTEKGDSGGPVISLEGNLVGVHRAGHHEGPTAVFACASRIDHFLAYEYNHIFSDRSPKPPSDDRTKVQALQQCFFK